ncbi:MAG: 50S ribosomal protein L11 [Promethearchaeota archaeon]
MSEKKLEIKALVTGGSASGGPPIGPAVGPTGINIKDVVDAINDKTQIFKGLTVPVRILCDPETKQFEIFIETPSTASLLLKELGVEMGSKSPGEEILGDLSMEQVINVAKAKQDIFLDKTFKACVKTVIGTALSIGATVDGQNPKSLQKAIDAGQYDDIIKKGEA